MALNEIRFFSLSLLSLSLWRFCMSDSFWLSKSWVCTIFAGRARIGNQDQNAPYVTYSPSSVHPLFVTTTNYNPPVTPHTAIIYLPLPRHTTCGIHLSTVVSPCHPPTNLQIPPILFYSTWSSRATSVPNFVLCLDRMLLSNIDYILLVQLWISLRVVECINRLRFHRSHAIRNHQINTFWLPHAAIHHHIPSTHFTQY